MYNNELVSVIIPVYNAEQFLKNTVLSAVEQTYFPMEIILVDDRSTDKSSEIIKTLKTDYPQILYHLQDKNGGAGKARNTALNLASGRYVAFLDADDIWDKRKTELQINLMKENNAILSYTAIEMIDENGLVIKEKRNVKDKLDYNFLLRNTMIATSSVIIDRNQVGNFQMHLRRGGQDYATWLKILREKQIAYGINEALVQYRVSNKSLSSNKFDSIRQVYEIQTIDEKINPIKAVFNTFCFIINALKKYFL